ncbi:uncharacterized protein K02A2.6-like [Ornithodoros turicata]|uniref:uncharacterized protein K02A2.6-like n=1 Tax=Ornithodoros turicata TaxID=34597 RepID=UPI0031390458
MTAEATTETFSKLATTFRMEPPASFNFSAPNEWSTWKRRFLRFYTVSGLDRQSGQQQVDALVYILGSRAEDIFQTFNLVTSETSDFKVVLDQFDKCFILRRNIIYERAKFNTRVQWEAESVDDFATSLHRLAETCDYGTLKDDLLRDRLVVGLSDTRLSEKLQLDSTLTLDKALTTARQHEAVKQQQAELRPLGDNCDVARVTTRRAGSIQLHTGTRSEPTKSKKRPSPTRGRKVCPWCGLQPHPRSQCRAKGCTSHKCNKRGHFANVCRSTSSNKSVQGFLGTSSATTTTSARSNWDITIAVNGQEILFRIDPGADETVVSEDTFRKRFPQLVLQPPNLQLSGPDGRSLKVIGKLPMQLSSNNVQSRQEDFVIRHLRHNLLGKPAIEGLCLLARIYNVRPKLLQPLSAYPQLFRCLGTIRGDYCLRLRSDATPFAITSPRRVLLPLYAQTRTELREMERLGVITEVQEPTDCCAPMIVVPKKTAGVRICVDLTELNRFVLREWYPIPSVEHTLGRLSGARILSKLDANSGFWQIPLSKESRLLTTFITPFGRFCFNRLPFGVSSAPGHFQRRMREILAGLDGVMCHMDDVLVFGPTPEDHDSRLRAALERLSAAGVTLNAQKCVFAVSTINFLGHRISGDGIRPDEHVLDAIQQLPVPSSKKDLRQLLGMATYLGRFVPHLADLLRPLTEMLSDKREFTWGPPQEDAFLRWKQLLSTPPVLGVYDVNKETTVSADASAYGLGAVFQKNTDGSRTVIAYASRTLSDPERRYAQIEKEGLALVWACEKLQD